MGTRLEIEPAFEDALEAAGLDSFEKYMQIRGGSPTSRHRHRETIPVSIPLGSSSGRFFLKRVFRVPPSHAIRPLLRGRPGYAQPAVEWEACGAMKAQGLPVMRRAAFGERRIAGIPTTAFLLVEESSLEHTVEQWLVPGFERPRGLASDEREALLFEIGDLVRRIADAGFIWPDLHAKHIFAAPSPGGQCEWTFCLIDLERVSRRAPSGAHSFGPSNDAATVSALQQLVESLSPLELTDRDFSRFLAGAKLDSRPSPEIMRVRDESSGLPRMSDDFIHPRRLQYSRKGGMHVDHRFQEYLDATRIQTVEDVFAHEQGRHLTKPGLSPHRDRLQLSLPVDAGRSLAAFLKRFRRPPLGEQLRRIFEGGRRYSSGRREARFAKQLWSLGVPTLSTVAYGQSMWGPIELRSFIITANLEGTSLEKLAGQLEGDPIGRIAWADKKEIIRQLAFIAGRMHRNRLVHRDFYLSHVFLRRRADGLIVLHVIDLGRMMSPRCCMRRWIVKDLAALDYSSPAALVTRADRVRFLYHYLFPAASGRVMPGDRRRVASLAAAVARKARRIAAHDARRTARFAQSEQM
ncbi:MAG TPA: lipopolysaccharide kinase InaA family protein [Phycisphaerae bacterium]|nr:lipopolysaccharide kinase InaA family protein [Phycisphaerae bacterium]